MTSTLTGANVTLRPPKEGDIDSRFRLGNDIDIFEMFGISRDDVPTVSRASAANWVQGIVEHPHAWIIEAREALLGVIRLDRLDIHDRRASMAIGIYDRNALGKGLGSEAISVLLGHAFGPLRLHRIGVRVLSYNQRAIRAYRKCGFVEEGREREAAFVNGAWHDDVMMGLLEHEFGR
ncbi:GCN5 family acetyltransferase [Rhizobium leguminosarum bv. trifolii CB782]|uniref:N-acetyltransferase n=1 Tax=Rhizobium hidalgonense TaxID=1538159 RepID=A0ABX4JI32_9HYPH|nr:GNAT family protein [Rhizobium hidalgonense]AHG44352.1 GCN5 family acetyltransferase [Rhizobium leguminosarum bv. trifolii CB782]EJC73929.1 acetyltransferase, ribosomal protein N-acetylase [Rhizobium leguminosarum bv. trifolii WSM2012]MDR9812473.1 GNAT family protein [Rhizobium hidalgonense]PDT19718.1 N-acetyltransferase [Rhizobium hidalgonense]PON05599.1 GCN5 family acetyltransferase [Rhizobium hidalgonense]